MAGGRLPAAPAPFNSAPGAAMGEYRPGVGAGSAPRWPVAVGCACCAVLSLSLAEGPRGPAAGWKGSNFRKEKRRTPPT